MVFFNKIEDLYKAYGALDEIGDTHKYKIE